MKILSYDSPIISRLNSLANGMLINIVFLICCLPIVTIGAARTALFTVSFRWANQKEAGVARFFQAFLKNLKTSTIPWLLTLAGLAFLFYDIFLIRNNAFAGGKICLAICVIAFVLLGLVQSQMFLFHAKFSCTVRQLFVNSALVVLANPLRALFVFCLNALPLAVLLVDSYTHAKFFPVWGLGYYALEGFLSAYAMKKVYTRLETRNEEDGEADEAPTETPEG